MANAIFEVGKRQIIITVLIAEVLTIIYFVEGGKIMEYIVLAIIAIVCLVIYAKSKDFSQSLLSYLLGLIAIYTISWSWPIFFGFSCALIFFLVVGLAISSAQLAIKIEKILTQAANFIDPRDKSLYSKLKLINSKKQRAGMLSNVEKAEGIRYMAFKNVSLAEMPIILEATEKLAVVTDLPCLKVIEFLLDISYLCDEERTGQQVERIFQAIRKSRTTPEEFFKIFTMTKQFVIEKKLSIDELLEKIERFSQLGTRPEDYRELIRKQI